jgi:hypothetical protein
MIHHMYNNFIILRFEFISTGGIGKLASSIIFTYFYIYPFHIKDIVYCSHEQSNPWELPTPKSSNKISSGYNHDGRRRKEGHG